MKKIGKQIGEFQGLPVYEAPGDGVAYMDLSGWDGRFYLQLDGSAEHQLREIKAELAKAKLRTRAEVDADIVRVLRAEVAKGHLYDCLALNCEPAPTLRALCAEETQDP